MISYNNPIFYNSYARLIIIKYMNSAQYALQLYHMISVMGTILFHGLAILCLFYYAILFPIPILHSLHDPFPIPILSFLNDPDPDPDIIYIFNVYPTSISLDYILPTILFHN